MNILINGRLASGHAINLTGVVGKMLALERKYKNINKLNIYGS